MLAKVRPFRLVNLLRSIGAFSTVLIISIGGVLGNFIASRLDSFFKRYELWIYLIFFSALIASAVLKIRNVYRHPKSQDENLLPPIRDLPPLPPGFTGREQELMELIAAINKGYRVLGLHGMGGIGKSTLAVKLANQVAQKFPDAQIPVNLRNNDFTALPITNAMKKVIWHFSRNEPLPDDQQQLESLYRSVLRGRRAILLLDGATNEEQVKPLIPPDNCTLVIVTSRQYFKWSNQFSILIDSLPPEDARKFLLKVFEKNNRIAEIAERADAIAQLCGYLPLALEIIAGRLANNPDLSVAYCEHELAERKGLIGDKVEVSLSLSYDLLSQQLKAHWRMLAIFPDTFDVRAASTVWEVEQAEAQNCLSDLRRCSLVKWNETTSRYALHDIARVYADSHLNPIERLEGLRRHAAYYVKIFDEANELYKLGGQATMRGLALFDLEWVNIRAGQSWAEKMADQEEYAAGLCSDYRYHGAYILELRMHPRERIHWLESALSAARKLKRRSAEGAHLSSIGKAYYDLGQVKQAIDLMKQAIDILRETGDRHRTGFCLGALGISYCELGDLKKAIEPLEQCLSIAREVRDRRIEVNALNGLGLVYMRLGQRESSIEFFKQSLAIAQEIEDRPGESNTLSNMGLACAAIGQVKLAIDYFNHSLTIAREIGLRQAESNLLIKLGAAYATLNDVKRAIEYHEQHLVIARETGDRHSEGIALSGLGDVCAMMGKHRQSIELFEQCVNIARETRDPKNEAYALASLGGAYATLGKTGDAIKLYEESLNIMQDIGSKTEEAAVLSSIGNIYSRLGKVRRAIELHQQALTIVQDIGWRLNEGLILGSLGRAYTKLGETKRAIELYEQQLAIAREIGDRKDESNALSNLGIAFMLLSEPKQAITYYQQCFAIAREIGDRRKECACLCMMGEAYFKLGKFFRAVGANKKSLAIAKEIGDKEQEGIALGSLGIMYAESSKPVKALEHHRQYFTIMQETGNLTGEAQALFLISSALNEIGKREQAIEKAEAALKIYEQTESPDANQVRRKLEEWRRTKPVFSGDAGEQT